MRIIRISDLLLGEQVDTGCWMVPRHLGDCPGDMWPLDHDVILEWE